MIGKDGVEKIIMVARGGTLSSPGWIAFAAALLSVALKEIVYQITHKVGREVGSAAVEANAWHHRSDALSSTVVFVMPAGDVKLEAEYKESATPHKHEANTEKWFFDETYHWNACKDKTCSENLNKAEHTFVWKTDKPATETEDGIKHEECSVCGRRRNESTVIPSTGKTPAVTDDPKVTTKPDTPEKPAKKNAWILPTVITVVVLAGAGAGTYFIIKNKKKITGDGGNGNSGAFFLLPDRTMVKNFLSVHPE